MNKTSILAWSAVACLVGTGSAAPAADYDLDYSVQAVYFIPNNRTPQPGYADKIDYTLKLLQTFFAQEMNTSRNPYGGKTFRLELDAQGKTKVRLVYGTQNDDFYLVDPMGRPNQELNNTGVARNKQIMMVFLEAHKISADGHVTFPYNPFASGSARDGMYTGFHVISSYLLTFDLPSALFSEENISVLGLAPDDGAVWLGGALDGRFMVGRVCAWIMGVIAHEMGHTFAIGHDFNHPGDHRVVSLPGHYPNLTGGADPTQWGSFIPRVEGNYFPLEAGTAVTQMLDSAFWASGGKHIRQVAGDCWAKGDGDFRPTIPTISGATMNVSRFFNTDAVFTDDQSPVAQITSPTTGDSVLSNRVDVTVSVSDMGGAGLSHLYFTAGGQIQELVPLSGQASATVTATVTMGAKGQSQIQVEVWDRQGNSGYTNINVNLTQDAPRFQWPWSYVSGPIFGETGTTYSYSAGSIDPEGDSVQYDFDWGDGTITRTGLMAQNTRVTQSHVWNVAGIYVVRVRAIDSNGAESPLSTCPVVMEVTAVVPNQPPVLGPIGDRSLPEGQALSIVLSASDPDGDAVTFSAAGLPSGATLSGENFSWTPSYTQSGAYPVTFTASDGKGGTGSETITITVTDVSGAPALAIGIFDSSLHLSRRVDFDGAKATGGVTAGYAYAWDFGDGGTSAEVAPTHVYSGDGYTVQLTVTRTSDGVRGSVTKSVTPWKYAASPDTNGNGKVDLGDILSMIPVFMEPFDTNPDAAFTQAAGVTDPSVKVLPLGAPRVVVSAGGAVNVNGAQATGGVTAGYTYDWLFGDGGTARGDRGSHTYTVDGRYTITLIVTASDGRRGSVAVAAPALWMKPFPKVPDINGDGTVGLADILSLIPVYMTPWTD